MKKSKDTDQTADSACRQTSDNPQTIRQDIQDNLQKLLVLKFEPALFRIVLSVLFVRNKVSVKQQQIERFKMLVKNQNTLRYLVLQ